MYDNRGTHISQKPAGTDRSLRKMEAVDLIASGHPEQDNPQKSPTPTPKTSAQARPDLPPCEHHLRYPQHAIKRLQPEAIETHFAGRVRNQPSTQNPPAPVELGSGRPMRPHDLEFLAMITPENSPCRDVSAGWCDRSSPPHRARSLSLPANARQSAQSCAKSAGCIPLPVRKMYWL